MLAPLPHSKSTSSKSKLIIASLPGWLDSSMQASRVLVHESGVDAIAAAASVQPARTTVCWLKRWRKPAWRFSQACCACSTVTSLSN
jgi:hypothetical protein